MGEEVPIEEEIVQATDTDAHLNRRGNELVAEQLEQILGSYVK